MGGCTRFGVRSTSWVRVGNGAVPWIGTMNDRQNNRVGPALEDVHRETAKLATITERNEADDFRAVVMDNMAEGLYTLDALGSVTSSDAAASQMLGWTKRTTATASRCTNRPLPATRSNQPPRRDSALSNSAPRADHPRGGSKRPLARTARYLPVAYSLAPLLSGATIQGVVASYSVTSAKRKSGRSPVSRTDSLLCRRSGRIHATIDEAVRPALTSPIVPLPRALPARNFCSEWIRPSGELIMREDFSFRMMDRPAS